MVQEAIESCFAGNDAIDVEVVVVDDGSTDGTQDYLESIDDERVRPIFQEHQGAQVARNKGQEAARGETIKHLDDDDHLVPGELVREYRTLRETEADVCYSDFYKVDEGEDESWVYTNAHHREVDGDFFTALVSGAVNRLQLAILFDAAAIADVRWDESLEYLQDVDFMLRASTRGLSCVKLDRPVAVHRMHRGPRISDVRQSASVRKRLRMKAEWFNKSYKKLHARNNVTDARRRATAKRLWQVGHMLAPYNWEIGQRWLRRAVEIDKNLSPNRSSKVLSLMDRLLSPIMVDRLSNPFRKYRLSSQQ
jgi:glycosyltransferase involved in cell wall biosynthesis